LKVRRKNALKIFAYHQNKTKKKQEYLPRVSLKIANQNKFNKTKKSEIKILL